MNTMNVYVVICRNNRSDETNISGVYSSYELAAKKQKSVESDTNCHNDSYSARIETYELDE